MTTPLAIRVVFWIWFFAALIVSRFSLLQTGSPSSAQGILLALTAALILAYRRIGAFRSWVDAIDLRRIVLFHATRFVGIYFLLLYRRGELPYEFAIPGGVGDIIVAALALVVGFFPFSEPNRIRAISIWNIVGLIDILLVVLSATRIGMAGGNELAALTRFPLSLLPTFLVPLIIGSHLAIFVRLHHETKTS